MYGASPYVDCAWPRFFLLISYLLSLGFVQKQRFSNEQKMKDLSLLHTKKKNMKGKKKKPLKVFGQEEYWHVSRGPCSWLKSKLMKGQACHNLASTSSLHSQHKLAHLPNICIKYTLARVKGCVCAQVTTQENDGELNVLQIWWPQPCRILFCFLFF